MPPARMRRVGRARIMRRRYLARRPLFRARIGRRPRQPNVYNFKRKFFLENWQTVTAGTPVGNGTDFFFSSLPNVTDFTNLYDMYMIKKIVVKLIPRITEATLNSGATTSNTNLPQVHSVIDYDDVTVPTSVNDLVQYQNHKMTRGHQIHTRTFVPKVEMTSNGANAPQAYRWLDCDAAVVPHRGIKWWFNAPNVAGTSVYYDLLVTYYFACKSVV